MDPGTVMERVSLVCVVFDRTIPNDELQFCMHLSWICNA